MVPVVSQDAPLIKRVRGPNYPADGDRPEVAVAYVNALYAAGEADALARYKQATHNILALNGRQHIGWKQSKRSWEDLPLSDGDVRVTMNYIGVAMRARVQRLTSSEINWRGIPDSNSMESRDRVRVAINLIKARWQALEMEDKARQAHMQAGATGVCAVKSFWNPNTGPLGPAKMIVDGPPDENGVSQPQEVFVDEAGQPVETADQAFQFRPGDTDSAIRTIFNIRCNPEATGWTEAEGLRWLIDEEVVPLTVARERFTQLAEQIRALDTPVSSLTFERMSRGSVTQRLPAGFTTSSPYAGSNQQQDPSSLTYIREYWEMRSDAFFPEGRLIVVVGGQVAYDGAWPQGVFPYAPIFGDPAVLSPFGRPVVNDLLSPQAVINREWTAIVKEGVANGAGQFIAWGIPGIPDSIPREDYKVIQIPPRSILANRPINDVIKRMDPAMVSPDRWRAIEQAKATFFDIAGYHEVSRGQIPPGLDSGVAIEHLLEQESAQIKDAVLAYKRALIQWARHQLAIARWGYGEEEKRWIPVDRPDLGYMLEGVDGVSLPDPDTIGLDIEYFRPQSESATRAEVKEMMAAGFIDPRQGLKIMDLGAGFDQAFESQTRHYARARKENIDFLAGQFVMAPTIDTVPVVGPMGAVEAPVGPRLEPHHIDPQSQQPFPFLLRDDDDHALHIDVHHEIALDEMQPWAIRAIALDHIANHREAMQEQQQMLALQVAGASAMMNPPEPAATAGSAK